MSSSEFTYLVKRKNSGYLSVVSFSVSDVASLNEWFFHKAFTKYEYFYYANLDSTRPKFELEPLHKWSLSCEILLHYPFRASKHIKYYGFGLMQAAMPNDILPHPPKSHTFQ